jgi:hypothetical protein
MTRTSPALSAIADDRFILIPRLLSGLAFPAGLTKPRLYSRSDYDEYLGRFDFSVNRFVAPAGASQENSGSSLSGARVSKFITETDNETSPVSFQWRRFVKIIAMEL